MNVIFETDTGIKKKYFTSPDWDDENTLFALRVTREESYNVLLQLKDWVRQLEFEAQRFRKENNEPA